MINHGLTWLGTGQQHEG